MCSRKARVFRAMSLTLE